MFNRRPYSRLLRIAKDGAHAASRGIEGLRRRKTGTDTREGSEG